MKAYVYIETEQTEQTEQSYILSVSRYGNLPIDKLRKL